MHFLMAMHHLKRYPTELEREGMFDISRTWGRDWCWYFFEKVQALKAQKIVWPSQWDDVWDNIAGYTSNYIPFGLKTHNTSHTSMGKQD